jgi:hypothetical protein
MYSGFQIRYSPQGCFSCSLFTNHAPIYTIPIRYLVGSSSVLSHKTITEAVSKQYRSSIEQSKKQKLRVEGLKFRVVRIDFWGFLGAGG